jgi:CheY-like chemotaxis protein
MIAALQDLLNVYLMPFALAVPLALLLFLLVWRHGDSRHADATSRFVAPAAPPQAEAPAASPMAPAASAPTRSVLIVDDSAVARAKLLKLFESAGYEVSIAQDGVEALEILGQKMVAVMVTDLEMPRMDGFELIAAVKGALATEDLPIIAITGHEELQARVHEVEGLFGIFKKPWNDRELLKRVNTLASVRSAALAAH